MHDVVCRASLVNERLSLLALPDDITKLIIAEDDNAAGRAGARRAWAACRRDGLKLSRRTPRPLQDWAEANLKREGRGLVLQWSASGAHK